MASADANQCVESNMYESHPYLYPCICINTFLICMCLYESWLCQCLCACWFLRYFPNLNFMCGIFFMQTNQWKKCRAWVELKILLFRKIFLLELFFFSVRAFSFSHFFISAFCLDACSGSFLCDLLCVCVFFCCCCSMPVLLPIRLSVWLSFSFYISLLRVWYREAHLRIPTSL